MIGWFILIPVAIVAVVLSVTGFEISWLNARVFALFNGAILGQNQTFGMIDTNLTNTLVGALFIVGGIFVGFSKEKKEDEFIANLRLSSLLWAVWVNYILLFLAFIFVYGMAFFTAMIYNMFTVLVIFIVRFNYILYKNTKAGTDEK